MKRPSQSHFAALIASVAVHALFCVQAILAAVRTGGMFLNDSFFWLFLPHNSLRFFLPPGWPITSSGVGQSPQVDWLRFAGNLAVAFPAPAVYGLLLGSVWFWLFGRRSKNNPQYIASMALLGVALSALGQSDLQGNPPRLNTAPPDSSLTVSNRAAKKDAYKAAITAVRSDQKSPAVMVELAIELARDKDLEIRQMAIGALLSVEPYISPTERASWGKLCGKLFRPMLDDIGIEARLGEPATVPQFRASLLGPLGLVAADSEVIAHFRRIATEQISSTNVTWRPEMYGPLFITTVHGDAAWAKKVQKAYENSTSPEMHARLLHALIGFRDPVLLRAGLDYALTNVVESREFMTLLLAGVLKETAAVRFEWLKENFELVSKRLEPKTLEVVAIDMISAGDARLFAEGELFLLDPKRRTPVYERVLGARKKELAPLFARRDKYRDGLARALDKGLKGNLHETSPSL